MTSTSPQRRKTLKVISPTKLLETMEPVTKDTIPEQSYKTPAQKLVDDCIELYHSTNPDFGVNETKERVNFEFFVRFIIFKSNRSLSLKNVDSVNHLGAMIKENRFKKFTYE